MPSDADNPTTERTWLGACGRFSGVDIRRLEERKEDKTPRPNPNYWHMFYVAARRHTEAVPN